METVGKRISKIREELKLSRPEFGKLLAAKVERKKPYSGEAVRQWESGEAEPAKEATAALATVSGKSESYIHFGEQQQAVPEGLPQEEIELLERYREADPRWQLSLRLLAMVATQDQRKIAGEVNMVIASLFGKKAKEMRPIGDARMRRLLSKSPEGWPPRAPKTPVKPKK